MVGYLEETGDREAAFAAEDEDREEEEEEESEEADGEEEKEEETRKEESLARKTKGDAAASFRIAGRAVMLLNQRHSFGTDNLVRKV